MFYSMLLDNIAIWLRLSYNIYYVTQYVIIHKCLEDTRYYRGYDWAKDFKIMNIFLSVEFMVDKILDKFACEIDVEYFDSIIENPNISIGYSIYCLKTQRFSGAVPVVFCFLLVTGLSRYSSPPGFDTR